MTLPGTSIRALVFDAPGCLRPVLVVVLSAVIDLEPVLRSAREQGDVLRYIYIGRSWEKPDRLAVFTERMKYAALAPFGLTRYVPSQDLLLVESPSRCQVGHCGRLAKCLEPRLPQSHSGPDRGCDQIEQHHGG